MASNLVEQIAELKADIDVEFEKALLAAVKNFPCIYLKDHPDFNNPRRNKVAWINISIMLKKRILDCQNRWYNFYQTFLYKLKTEDIKTWPHYESIKEMQPFIAQSYSEFIQMKLPIQDLKPTPLQKHTLFKELIVCRVVLLNPKTPLELIQKFWTATAEKLNSLPEGTQMPVINWQKFWWDLKVKFVEFRSKLRMGSNELVTEDYQHFIKFYTVRCSNGYVCYAPLGKNTEFGCIGPNGRICQKRSAPLDLETGLCLFCQAIPKNYCDICSMIKKEETIVCEVKNWSSIAINLLPFQLRTFAELSVCFPCSNNLKKKAAFAWKVCRVCEKSHNSLENLYDYDNELLLNNFMQATNITFSAMDGLPGYICKLCKVRMQQFNNFYLRFSRAQDRLREFQRTQFIHIDASEKEKHSTTEIPKPLLTSQTQTEGTPKLDCSELLISKIAAKRFSTDGPGPPTKQVSEATMQSIPPNPEKSAYTKGTMSKRVRILPSEGYHHRERCVALAPTNGVIRMRPDCAPNTITPLIKGGICTLPSGNEPVPLFSKNTGVTIEKRPEVFIVTGEHEDQPPAVLISKHTSAMEVSNLAHVTDEILIVPNSAKNLDYSYPTPPNRNVIPATELTNEISSNVSALFVESRCCPPTQKTSLQTKDAVRLDGSATTPILFQPSKGSQNESISAIFPPKVTKLRIPPNLNVPEEQFVDEFQITFVSEKINRKTIHQSSADSVAFTPNAASSRQIFNANKIKEERDDGNGSQTTILYPDSFELQNSSINADSSPNINKMITKQEPVDEENSFEYINPSFLLSVVEDPSKNHVVKETNTSIDQNNAPKKEINPENPSEAHTTCKYKTPKTIRLKSLCVRLKRSGHLKKIASMHGHLQMNPITIPGSRKSSRSLNIKKKS